MSDNVKTIDVEIRLQLSVSVAKWANEYGVLVTDLEEGRLSEIIAEDVQIYLEGLGDDDLKAMAAQVGPLFTVAGQEVIVEEHHEKEIFVAFSVHSWGKGDSIKDAKAALKDHGGDMRRFYVQKLPDGSRNVWVDNMGVMHWDWAPGADISGKCEIVFRKGA